MKYVDNIIGVFTRRREPRGEPVWSNPRLNVRQPLNINWQDAPDPVRQSDFNSRPARMPKAIVGVNIADWQAVQQDEFGYPQFAPSHTAKFLLGYGGQLAWEERSNIVSPQSVPYGSQMVVNPEQVYYPLMGS